ncbi:MAG TPA: NAD(P)H-binding protein [Prolixibacteraceae bacterium]|nr:NAD(P)H-binding protein [Prolixibacteraceae bacterium]
MNKIAIVAGATGLVGQQLINELTANSAYKKIYIIARREPHIQHPKIKTIITNFDQLEQLNLPEKADHCYCSLGTTKKKSGKKGLEKVDYHYVQKLLSVCRQHDINQFMVVSSKGANASSPFFYIRVKGLMEEAVKQSGIETTYILRPSLITGKRHEFRLGEKMADYFFRILNPLLIGKLKKIRSVSATKIARCMVSLAQNGEKGNYIIESDLIQSY